MDKKTIEKEIKNLTSTLEKQIKNLKEKASDVIEDERVQKVLNTISSKTVDFLGQVKDKVSDLWEYYSDPEEVAKIVDNIKVVSKNVYDASLAKINEVKNNKDVQKAVASAEKFLKATYDKSADVAKGAFDKAMENEDVKQAFDTAVSAYNNVKDVVTDYFEKPEVQENIEKAKDVTIDIAEKGVAALKKWLKSDKKGKK